MTPTINLLRERGGETGFELNTLNFTEMFVVNLI